MQNVESEFSLVRVPVHLHQFVVDQDYGKYTAIDQAVWRYVMRQNYNFLGKRAHEAYVGGLRASGIGVEKIPNVAEDMSKALAQIGWGAVTIDGFIPAVAFFDFQAHGILPIACDIRTYDHIAYTPAPDIIHEAAGHAPIILDEKYREYLKIFGDIGSKAVSSRQDYELYEAIRLLSIVKEDPNATEEEIKAAEENLDAKSKAVTEISEATELSRLYWWTVEYGLIGDVDNPQIYGAGLLSSVGESMNCLKPEVKKIPFSLEACISTDFDITKQQPQLFVCRDFDQLIEAVQEYAKRMAINIGGTESLIKALNMGQTSTTVYSSGLQVSGMVTRLVYDDNNEAIYLNTTGPTALAINNQELPGHGKTYHHEGFGSPIGLLQGESTPLELMNDEQLAALGLVVDQETTLTFASGVVVTGKVAYIHRENDKIVLIGFDNCTVTRGDQSLFQAEWGTYDMAVGEKVVSVFAGAADREHFESGTHNPSDTKTKRPTYSPQMIKLQGLYQTVRDLREQAVKGEELQTKLTEVLATLDAEYQNDWLLRLEILELFITNQLLADKQTELRSTLQTLASQQDDNRELILNGLGLLDQVSA
ncbi:aromatic amino acid hydroxylase [Brevibacillus dissolubilis]|uniref:aromatic amino acid hydroxylase n=1 Tax=Brevibacillus dissolubilis TaxID=1844116 RepID=UPI0011177CAD|nr:aromatic amino acid hydroxylase [Brevibacillus dissolubilis]